MDPNNDLAFASKEKIDYWQSVDLYIGGTEHAVGHLLYSRMWHKFLYDLGYVPTDEPFKKLVNQGMIQGVSSFIYRLGRGYAVVDNEKWDLEKIPNVFISKDIDDIIKKEDDTLTEIKPGEREKVFNPSETALYVSNKVYSIMHEVRAMGLPINGPEYTTHIVDELHAEISLVQDNVLDIEAFKQKSRLSKANDYFITNEKGQFLCGSAVEKMSKSKHNVVNPDDVIAKYGADCFRMFEMFLGPLDQSKPWDDKGIDGVGKFIRRFWRLFYDEKGTWRVTTDAATDAENKVLHKTLKKISEDIERLQFNTCISQFMICLNELNDLKCTKRSVLEPLLIALAPFAPFLTEELWQALGNSGSVHHATFPAVEEKYLVESAFTYPISINGKVRANLPFALDLTEADVKASVLADETVQKWLEGKEAKKFIFVKGRIINVVV
jgi:leucyl-tRNA synthetase